MTDTVIYNLIDALIFCVCVIFALLLTLLLCNSPFSQYQRSRHIDERSKQTSHVDKSLRLFSALSVLSFSVLSYNMLSYLIVSYQAWAKTNGVRLPQQIMGNGGIIGSEDQRVQLHVWEWLTSSTLFQDFAETICGDSARFLWTQQALLVSMGWTLYMSFEGCLEILIPVT